MDKDQENKLLARLEKLKKIAGNERQPENSRNIAKKEIDKANKQLEELKKSSKGCCKEKPDSKLDELIMKREKAKKILNDSSKPPASRKGAQFAVNALDASIAILEAKQKKPEANETKSSSDGRKKTRTGNTKKSTKKASDKEIKKPSMKIETAIKKLLQIRDGEKQAETSEILALASVIDNSRKKRARTLDRNKTSKKRLAPTANNVLRWSTSPGTYDLIGIDCMKTATPTQITRTVKRSKVLGLFNIKR